MPQKGATVEAQRPQVVQEAKEVRPREPFPSAPTEQMAPPITGIKGVGAGKGVKEPWEMTREEYNKTIEWKPIKSLPDDARKMTTYQGKEDMYYSGETGRHYTVYNNVIKKSPPSTKELGFIPYKHERHIQEALSEGKPVPTKVAYEYPETQKLFSQKYGEVKIPVRSEIFEAVGAKPGNVFANYIKLQQKHPEYFHTPAHAKKHVEYVLDAPKIIFPATKEGYTLLVRQNGKNKVAVVEFVLKGGKYRVRSAHEITTKQLEEKIKKAQHGGRKPLFLGEVPPQGGEISHRAAAVPSDTLRVEPSSKETIPPTPGEVKPTPPKDIIQEQIGFNPCFSGIRS